MQEKEFLNLLINQFEDGEEEIWRLSECVFRNRDEAERFFERQERYYLRMVGAIYSADDKTMLAEPISLAIDSQSKPVLFEMIKRIVSHPTLRLKFMAFFLILLCRILKTLFNTDSPENSQNVQDISKAIRAVFMSIGIYSKDVQEPKLVADAIRQAFADKGRKGGKTTNIINRDERTRIKQYWLEHIAVIPRNISNQEAARMLAKAKVGPNKLTGFKERKLAEIVREAKMENQK